MQNVKMSRKGNTLTIEVDLTADFGPSGSGKTNTVATTRGNAAVPGTEGFKLGLNLFRYPNASLTAAR